jgi:hypothetical protein
MSVQGFPVGAEPVSCKCCRWVLLLQRPPLPVHKCSSWAVCGGLLWQIKKPVDFLHRVPNWQKSALTKRNPGWLFSRCSSGTLHSFELHGFSIIASRLSLANSRKTWIPNLAVMLPSLTFSASLLLRTGKPHGWSLSLITEVPSRAQEKEVQGTAIMAQLYFLSRICFSSFCLTLRFVTSCAGPCLTSISSASLPLLLKVFATPPIPLYRSSRRPSVPADSWCRGCSP